MTEAEIYTIAQKAVEEINKDLYIVEMSLKRDNAIFIYLDTEAQGSVQIDDCVKISKFIEANLDREKEDFSLEVSSAGLDRPLKDWRQFRKNIGKNLLIVLKDGSKIQAKLLQANEESFSVERKNKKEKIEHTFSYSDPKKVNIEVVF